MRRRRGDGEAAARRRRGDAEASTRLRRGYKDVKAIGYGAAGGRGNKTINKRIRNDRQILLIIVLHSTVIPVIFLVSVITRYQIQPVSVFFGRY